VKFFNKEWSLYRSITRLVAVLYLDKDKFINYVVQSFKLFEAGILFYYETGYIIFSYYIYMVDTKEYNLYSFKIKELKHDGQAKIVEDTSFLTLDNDSIRLPSTMDFPLWGGVCDMCHLLHTIQIVLFIAVIVNIR
jgi:hypothetical protein